MREENAWQKVVVVVGCSSAAGKVGSVAATFVASVAQRLPAERIPVRTKNLFTDQPCQKKDIRELTLSN